ncbi:hypothetical protein [Paraburkholderia azotifigens]|uniref:hypothetical protein n=1 Tax=Paraburkholderia azotifigens TaxID=2057004 RepID=UPI0011BE42BC
MRTRLQDGVAEPTVNSNGHQVSASVRVGVLDAFERQAEKDGLKIVPTGIPVTITVEEYSTRSSAARFWFGALAGSDHIKAMVEVGDARFEVEDTARTAINGIDIVAMDVGIEAANGVAMLAGLPIAEESAAGR